MPQAARGVDPLLGLPLPADFEMDIFLVTAGLRTLGKLEYVLPVDTVAVRRSLEREGLRTLVMPGSFSGGCDIYFCREGRLLRHVHALELTQRRRQIDHLRAVASIRLGALHGYPQCCIDAFVATQTQRDADVLIRLGGAPGAAHNPLINFFLHSIAPVGFVPCRLDCPAAHARALEVLQALERVHGVPVDAVVEALRGVVMWFHGPHFLFFRGVEEQGAAGFRFEQVSASAAVTRMPRVPAHVLADRRVREAARAMSSGTRVRIREAGIDVLGPRGVVLQWEAATLHDRILAFTSEEPHCVRAPAIVEVAEAAS